VKQFLTENGTYLSSIIVTSSTFRVQVPRTVAVYLVNSKPDETFVFIGASNLPPGYSGSCTESPSSDQRNGAVIFRLLISYIMGVPLKKKSERTKKLLHNFKYLCSRYLRYR